MANDYLIYGLHRSGTDYLEETIRINFEKERIVNVSDLWKHSLDDPAGFNKAEYNTKPILIIYKNPYSWMETLAFGPREDFAGSTDWYTKMEEFQDPDFRIGELPDRPWINLQSSAAVYRYWVDNWMFRNNIVNRTVWVKYEDLLVPGTRKTVLDNIARKFAWQQQTTVWEVPEFGTVPGDSHYNIFWDHYYIQQKPHHITTKHVLEMNNIIDVEIIQNMGYEPTYETPWS